MKNIEVLQEIDDKLSSIHLIEQNGNYGFTHDTGKNECLKCIIEIKRLLDETRIERNMEIKENNL